MEIDSFKILLLLSLHTSAQVQHMPSECQRVDLELPNWTCNESFCVSLDNSTTAICCEWTTDNDCQTIHQVSCDMSLYDPRKNPEAKIRTTRTDEQFRRCYDQCCPFGYTCSDRECLMTVEEAMYGNPLDLIRGKCISHCDVDDGCCIANCISPDNNPCTASTFSSTFMTKISSTSLQSSPIPTSTSPGNSTLVQSTASSTIHTGWTESTAWSGTATSTSSTTQSSARNESLISAVSPSSAPEMHGKLIGGLVGGAVSAIILGAVGILLWRRRCPRALRNKDKLELTKPHIDGRHSKNCANALAVANKRKEKASCESDTTSLPRYSTPPGQMIAIPLQWEAATTAGGTHTKDWAVSVGAAEREASLASPVATVQSLGTEGSDRSGGRVKVKAKTRNKSVSVTTKGSPVKEQEQC